MPTVSRNRNEESRGVSFFCGKSYKHHRFSHNHNMMLSVKNKYFWRKQFLTSQNEGHVEAQSSQLKGCSVDDHLSEVALGKVEILGGVEAVEVGRDKVVKVEAGSLAEANRGRRQDGHRGHDQRGPRLQKK